MGEPGLTNAFLWLLISMCNLADSHTISVSMYIDRHVQFATNVAQILSAPAFYPESAVHSPALQLIC